MKYTFTAQDERGRFIERTVETDDITEVVRIMGVFLESLPLKIKGDLELVERPAPGDFDVCKHLKSVLE